MDKKGFAPVSIILVVALLIAGLFVIGNFIRLRNNVVTQKQETPAVKEVNNSSSSVAPWPEPKPIEVTRENLIGIWHECDMMPSGWCDHYSFYSSGKYRLYKNSMDCAKTIGDEAGLWTLNGTQLTLTVKEQTVFQGGQLVPSSGSCGSPQTLKGATPRKVVLSTPRVENYTLVPITGPVKEGKITIDLKDVAYPGFLFSDKPYWRFGDNPSCYYCYHDTDEFPEPPDF
jgi:hypothetical protein